MIRKGSRARLRSSGVQGVVGYWHDGDHGDREPDEPLDVPYPYTLTVGGAGGDPLTVAEDELEVIWP